MRVCVELGGEGREGGGGSGWSVHQDLDTRNANTEQQQPPTESCCLPTEAHIRALHTHKTRKINW